MSTKNRDTRTVKIAPGDRATQGISHKHCRLVQRNDGYGYEFAAGATTEAAMAASANTTDATRPPLYLRGLKAEVSREEL